MHDGAVRRLLDLAAHTGQFPEAVEATAERPTLAETAEVLRSSAREERRERATAIYEAYFQGDYEDLADLLLDAL